jgi:hypothetical protein
VGGGKVRCLLGKKLLKFCVVGTGPLSSWTSTPRAPGQIFSAGSFHELQQASNDIIGMHSGPPGNVVFVDNTRTVEKRKTICLVGLTMTLA